MGILQKSLYGTRDAARNFQQHVRGIMTQAGFRVGRYSPCTFWHPQRMIKTFVHGDDFVSVGTEAQLNWMEGYLKKKFEVKINRIGHGANVKREGRILNRIIRATKEGFELEADQRHADLIIHDLDLDQAKGISTPGTDEKPWEDEEDGKEVDARNGRRFRKIAARASYLALDRADLQYACKETSQGMAAPLGRHWRKLKRIGRYLIQHPRAVCQYKWQPDDSTVRVYSDSDWAGCRRTARSTSGGVVMRGSHYLRSWSSTQKNVTLSSAEAELLAVVKASSEAVGICQLMADWGQEVHGMVYSDSSAALGIVKRKGNGKLRHVKVGMLWVQEMSDEGRLEYKKVQGPENPADAMTKYLGKKTMDAHLKKMGIELHSGRAEASLRIGI